MRAVTFDFGQTLAELDHEFLAQRLSERGQRYDAGAARAASNEAWAHYGTQTARSREAASHGGAWRSMMALLLERGGVPAARREELTTWLWAEQPLQNLWRKPIPGMIELVHELRRQGTAVGVLSNSEGHLAELAELLGWGRSFDVIIDSGKVGFDKPDPRIFELAAGALGVAPDELIHVGDSWEADVQGALGVAARAVWFDARHRDRALPSGVDGAGSASELREVLARLLLVS
jgi:putative hydrolase of the HAD superfamily